METATADAKAGGVVAELTQRFGPDVAELAHQIALKNGTEVRPVFLHFRNLANRFSDALVVQAAKECLAASEFDASYFKHRIRNRLNSAPPKHRYCTGGASALEILPNGKYARCSKLGGIEQYIGSLRDEGAIKTLRIDTDDMGCGVRCPEMMCFAWNVFRANDLDSFNAGIAEHGIKGLYRPESRYQTPDIFIRWKITDVCNYTCSYCTDWKTVNAKGVELTDDEVMQAAQKIVDAFDNISLRFTGGEPSARRCYVDLMRFFHSNLEKITNIEIRTNFSFQQKHKEVLSWDWKGKFHVHVGCHVADKNFMPWRFVETVRSVPNSDYVFKFVANDKNREHVEFFKQYFVKHGIPPRRIIVAEMTGEMDKFSAGNDSTKSLMSGSEIPKARQTIEKMDPLEHQATPRRREDIFVRRVGGGSRLDMAVSSDKPGWPALFVRSTARLRQRLHFGARAFSKRVVAVTDNTTSRGT